MCGILTIAGAPHGARASRANVEALAKSLKHRGPNGIRSWASSENGIAMAHARLSIIDLEGGWQPLLEDDGSALCFNGEIYNYRELKTELLQLGHTFSTVSDSEVLLKALRQWGPSALGRLRGMFAFTYFDKQSRTLMLARDQIGIKPLYYTVEDSTDAGRTLTVSSELRALAIHRRSEPKIDRHALVEYVSIGYALAPRTILEDVFQLPHGTYAIWSEGQLKTQRYFDLADAANAQAGRSLSTSAALEATDSLIADSVRAQLVADVPVGVFLSGGIDSSLVSYYASRAGTPKPRAFTADFDEREFSELAQARMAAATCGLEQTVVHVTHEVLLKSLKEIPWASDAPIFDSSFIPSYLLCRETSQHIRVVLSGDGGDELFLGYPTYKADRAARHLRPFRSVAQPALTALGSALPTRFGKLSFDYKVRAFARSFARPMAEAHCGWRELVSLDVVSRLFAAKEKDFAESAHPRHHFARLLEKVRGANPLTALSYVDIETWLVNDILVKSDRASMAHGLEVRVPLLDVQLAEFALGLPDRLKMPGNETKTLLKQLVARHLTTDQARLPKQGFSAPISRWLTEHFGKELDMLPRQCDERLSLNPETVSELIDQHRKKSRDHGLILWALVGLVSWHDRLVTNRADLKKKGQKP